MISAMAYLIESYSNDDESVWVSDIGTEIACACLIYRSSFLHALEPLKNVFETIINLQ